jgi:PAS domain-containing protein
VSSTQWLVIALATPIALVVGGLAGWTLAGPRRAGRAAEPVPTTGGSPAPSAGVGAAEVPGRSLGAGLAEVPIGRFALALDSIEQGVVLLDVDRTELFRNRAARRYS